MNNLEFLNCISRSFKKFLETHSRSNQKLKILHGEIAFDISNKLGEDYTVKSLGFEKGKEGKIQGRYINKNVDITISKGEADIAGIGIKFVMQNYSQNSNNYFENMLGETANIRSSNIPYFQIFIIPDEIPYYNDKKEITKWEAFSSHNVHKYKILSEDLVETSIHTPIKTLLYVIQLPTIESKLSVINSSNYKSHYESLQDFKVLSTTNNNFGPFSANVIFNNYEEFIEKTIFRIRSI